MKKSIIVFSVLVMAMWYLIGSKQESINYLKHSNELFSPPKLTQIESLPTSEVFQTKCENYIDLSELSGQWITQRYHAIKPLLKTKQDNAVSENWLDYATWKSGLGVIDGRIMREGFNDNLLDYDLEYATDIEADLLEELIYSSNFNELYSQVYQGNLPVGKLYFGEHIYTLIGYLLTSNTHNKPRAIKSLLNISDLYVGYSDLVYATQEGLPVDLVNQLYDASNLDADYILIERGYLDSFLTIALTYGRYDLAMFWLSVGSSVQPDIFNVNALDLLAQNHFKFSQKQIDNLFTRISKNHKQPNLRKTYDLLKVITSDDSFTKGEIKSSIRHPLNKENIISAMDIVDSIYDISLNDFHGVSDEYKKNCYSKLGKKLVIHIVNNFVEEHVEDPKEGQISEIEQQIKSVKDKFISANDIETELGGEQRLGQKNFVEHYREGRIQEKVNLLKEYNKSNSEYMEIKPTIDEVFKLAKLGKWEEALTLLKSLKMQNNEAANTLIVLAATTNASSDIFDSLLNEGAQLNEIVTYWLVRLNNIDVLNHLVPKGLSLHHLDGSNKTTVYNAVKFEAFEVLQVLLSKGVDIGIDDLGLDALDIALMRLSQSGANDKYIDELINTGGAEVEQSHKDIVNNLFDNNLLLYIQLKNKYPGLH